MNLELGLQLFSVREELEKDFIGTLEKISKIGYKNLELFVHDADNGVKIGGLEAPELKKILNELDLNPVSMHVGPLNDETLEEAIAYNKEIGSTGIGYAIDFYKNKQYVLDLCETLNRYGEKCKANGIQLYYHNHFQEFQKFDGEYILDILLNNTDEDLVKLEFDTYWAKRGGINPIEYLRKVGKRCNLVHQKDLPANVTPVNALQALGENTEVNFDQFAKFSKPEYFTEVGEGCMDIKGIINTVRDIGEAKYIFVEQDLTTKNELESIEISLNNFKKLLNYE